MAEKKEHKGRQEGRGEEEKKLVDHVVMVTFKGRRGFHSQFHHPKSQHIVLVLQPNVLYDVKVLVVVVALVVFAVFVVVAVVVVVVAAAVVVAFVVVVAVVVVVSVVVVSVVVFVVSVVVVVVAFVVAVVVFVNRKTSVLLNRSLLGVA